MKQIALFSLALISLTACETETYVDYYLANGTADTLVVSGKNIILSEEINEMVMPYETIQLSNWSKRGKETAAFKPEIMFGTDLLIRKQQGDTLKKDYLKLGNWDFELSESSGTANHDYTLEAGPEDF